MKRFVTILLLFSALMPAVYSSSIIASTLDVQRDLFLLAEKALEQNERSQYWDLLKQVGDYPLYPYLRYYDLKKRIDTATSREVLSFLQAFDESPVSANLRTKWLLALAKKGQWQVFLKHYRHTGNKALHCLREQGRTETIQDYDSASQIESIWLTGFDLSAACDELINHWTSKKLITVDMYKQRIRLSLKKNNFKLARFLQSQLTGQDRQQIDLWLKVYQDPRLLMDSKTLEHADASRLIEDKFPALAWYYPDQAIQFANSINQYKNISVDKGKIIQILAISLARSFHVEAETWLNKVPEKNASERVKKWRIRTALHKGNWQQVITHYNSLGNSNRQQDRWKYWQARAFSETGQNEKASLLFHKIAQQRSYEGFLAADMLDKDYEFNHKTLSIDYDFVEVLKNNTGMARARELVRLKRFPQARSEWNLATAGFTDKQMASAAWLAFKWGWSHQTIITLAGLSEWNDLSLRFPVKHIKEIRKYTRSTIIDPALALAVIRQESAFQENALSRANARGLMQLMPATAKQVAKQLKLKLSNLGQLDSPDMNIQLGVFYLNDIKHQLMKHPVLAIAAYNAGKRRVENWLSIKQGVAVDVWIETIPFRETRNYLRNILAYTVVYEKRLGLPIGKMTDRMPPLPTIGQHKQLDI